MNSSMESVKKTVLTYRAQKEESQYYSLNLEEKMQVVLFSFLLFFFQRRAPPVSVAASVQHGLTDRESSIFL